MVLFERSENKPEKNETVFCSTCRREVKLKNFRVVLVAGRKTVEGECPICGSRYLKPFLPPEKYS